MEEPPGGEEQVRRLAQKNESLLRKTIEDQQSQLNKKDDQITLLIQAINTASGSRQVSVYNVSSADSRPTITANASASNAVWQVQNLVLVRQDATILLNALNNRIMNGEWSSIFKKFPTERNRAISELDAAIEALTELDLSKLEQEPEQSKKLHPMRKFLLKALDKGKKTYKLIESLSGGVERLGKIALAYNSLAHWAGLPEIPADLLLPKL